MTTRRSIVMVLSAALLAACGGAGEDPSAAAAPAAPAAPGAPAPAEPGAGPVTPAPPVVAPAPPAPDPVSPTTPEPGGVTTVADAPPTPPATPPALPAGLVLRESFGPGQGYERPSGGNGVLRSTLSSELDGFWAEAPGRGEVRWTAPEQSWVFAGCSTDPWEAPSELQPYNGCTVSPWRDGVVHFPDALVPFTGLPGPYVISADLYPSALAGTYVAVGLSASPATTANLQGAGQLWLVVRPDGAYELRRGAADVLASGRTTLSGYNPVSLRYDPVAGQVSATVNGAAVGPFDAPGVAPRYLVLEGQGVLDNLLVHAAR